MSTPTAVPRGADDPAAAVDPADYAFTRRAWVPAPALAVYDLVSDVSRIGQWSPSAFEVRYDDGAGPEPGAWFGGRNRGRGREWDSRSQVSAARPGAEFAFVVGGLDDGVVSWRWTFRDDGPGSVVAQEWGLLRVIPSLGATRRELDALRAAMETSVEDTLLALSRWLHAQQAG